MSIRHAGFDTSVLGAAFFHHIHATQYLDARRHRRRDSGRHLINLVQHTVNAKANGGNVPAGLEMNIAGALVKRVLPKPVDQMDDVMIVCIKRTPGLAELNELLKITDAAGGTLLFFAPLDRAGQVIKLTHIARDIERIGHHHLNIQAQHVAQITLPACYKRLAGCNNRVAAIYLYRQDIALGCVLGRHHFGDRAHIYF